MQDRYFIFDGIKSKDVGLHIYRKSGMANMPTIGDADIETHTNKYKNHPHNYSVTRENLSFSIDVIYIDNCGNIGKWTSDKYREVGKWLIHNTYKEFQSTDDMGKVYYAILTSMSDFEMSNNQGYLTLHFSTNSPFAWSTKSIDIIDGRRAKRKFVYNSGNIYDWYYNNIHIQSRKKQDVIIKNKRTGQEVVIKNILNTEIVYIDNYNKIITSNMPQKNIFKDFNREWFYTVYGENDIEIELDGVMRIEGQYPIF